MKLQRNNRESGSFTVLFLILIVIIVGGVSLSFYVGQQVERKIALQNSTDAATMSMAHHASQGLNMISANNLAIGAALHVAAAVPIVEAYASLIYAFTQSPWETITEGAKDTLGLVGVGFIKSMDRYQKAIWNRLGHVTAVYISVATGVTAFNRFLETYWLIPTPARGIEVARFNVPGSVSLPLQKRQIAAGNLSQMFLMRYDGLANAGARNTMCHTLRASKSIRDNQPEHDDFLIWLKGPIDTVGGVTSDIVDAMSKVTGFLSKYLPVKITFVGCGYGLRSPLVKLMLDMARLPGKLSSLKLVDYVKHIQAQKFVVIDVNLDTDVTGSVPPQCQPFVEALKAARLADGVWKTVFGDEKAAEEVSARVLLAETWEKMQKQVKKSPVEPKKSDYICARVGFAYSYPANRVGALGNRLSWLRKQDCDAKAATDWEAKLEHWKKKRSPYHCEETDAEGNVIATRYGHIPYNGKCVNLRTYNWRCPVNPYVKAHKDEFEKVSLDKGGVIDCTKIPKKIKKFKKSCNELFPDNGDIASDDRIQVVDWGRQIDAYTGKLDDFWRVFSTEERDPTEIGFTYVKDEAAFKKSVHFMTIGANPLRHIEELDMPRECAKLVKNDGSNDTCDIGAMVGIAKAIQKSRDPQLSEEKEAMLDAMSGSMRVAMQEEVGALASAWSRAQWAYAETHVVKDTGTSFDERSLFWPNWHARLHPTSHDAMRNGLMLVFRRGVPGIIDGLVQYVP